MAARLALELHDRRVLRAQDELVMPKAAGLPVAVVLPKDYDVYLDQLMSSFSPLSSLASIFLGLWEDKVDGDTGTVLAGLSSLIGA